MTAPAELRYTVEDRVATITLNRPDRLNSFTWTMVDAWAGDHARAP